MIDTKIEEHYQCVLRRCQISYKRVRNEFRWLIELILRLSFSLLWIFHCKKTNIMYPKSAFRYLWNEILFTWAFNIRTVNVNKCSICRRLSISQSRFASNSNSTKFMILRFTQHSKPPIKITRSHFKRFTKFRGFNWNAQLHATIATGYLSLYNL